MDKETILKYLVNGIAEMALKGENDWNSCLSYLEIEFGNPKSQESPVEVAEKALNYFND